jgi:hypothetical protein
MVETDAVRAGQEPVSKIATVISNIWMPLAFAYFYGLPYLFPKKNVPSEE